MTCYLYVWFDNNEPFYVGIGGENRLKSKKRNKPATSKRRKSESKGAFKQEVIMSASRKTCEEMEKFLIKSYGTITNGGVLLNFTEGGDGGDTFSFQTPERKKEIVEKILSKVVTEVRIECGKKGGPISAEINKQRGNGPWDPNWVEKGRLAAKQFLEENPDFLPEIGIKGAKSSWCGESGQLHREVNAASCRETGKKNKGSRWVNDGLIEKKIRPGEKLPDGFEFGRLPRQKCVIIDPGENQP